MRVLAMLIAGFGSAVLVLPMITLGQANSAPNSTPEKPDAARKFRAYLEADWKGWMQLYPEIATLVPPLLINVRNSFVSASTSSWPPKRLRSRRQSAPPATYRSSWRLRAIRSAPA